MSYMDISVRDYSEATAARDAVPGGGSVSAVAGALGAALTAMVCNFTAGNPKYAEHELRVSEILAQAQSLRQTLLELADQDIEVYQDVTAAYKLPRTTTEDKEARQQAIQEALVGAAVVPLAIAKAARGVLALAGDLVDIGNPNLASDVGVAALLAQAALRGAALNVEINAAVIKDVEATGSMRAYLEEALPEGRELCEAVVGKVLTKIRG